MITVTSAEFQKQFGRYREAAQREPVQVTSYGRESVVLLSSTEYEQYTRIKDGMRQALYAHEIPEDILNNMMDAEIPAHTAQYNHEYIT